MISNRQSNILDKLNSKPSYTDPRNGNKYWFKDNKFTEDYNRSTTAWGVMHRVNGPAFVSVHGDEWYLNGKLHRINGPAIEWPGGKGAYYLNNKSLTKNEFDAIPMDQRADYNL